MHENRRARGWKRLTAVQPGGPVVGGVATLEVRWILPGQLENAVAGWFGRFPARVETREDMYLFDPFLPGLSVKLRGSRFLDVKVYQGGRGLLEMAGARGRIQAWQKWSFSCERPGSGSEDPAGWQPVRKTRRIGRFSPASVPGPRVAGADEPGCEVELTEIRARREAWWSLGFEAAGPATLQRGELERTAALVFAEALPRGIELAADESRSYAEWLRRPRGGEIGALGLPPRSRRDQLGSGPKAPIASRARMTRSRGAFASIAPRCRAPDTRGRGMFRPSRPRRRRP